MDSALDEPIVQVVEKLGLFRRFHFEPEVVVNDRVHFFFVSLNEHDVVVFRIRFLILHAEWLAKHETTKC